MGKMKILRTHPGTRLAASVLVLFLVSPVFCPNNQTIASASEIVARDPESDRPLGILLEGNQKEILASKSLQALLKSEGLIEGSFYPTLKVQSYRLSQNHKRSKKEMELLCVRIKKEHPSIGICELNVPLKPSANQSIKIEKNSCELNPADQIVRTFAPILDHQKKQACELFVTKDSRYDYTKIITEKGLTPFWAQEYIGSDLLKEEMEKMKIDTSSATEKLVILDSGIESHGEQVSNLIFGPNPSSVVSGEESNPYVAVGSKEDYLEFNEKLEKKHQQNQPWPRVINNSMGWGYSGLSEKVVENLADKNVVFVTAAGNDGDDLATQEPMKDSLSRNGHAIVVSSHAPDGLSSGFTNFGAGVDITAPSDSRILSFTSKGEPKIFGGTSGAAPLVTGSILSFELISGIPLSTKEYKDLLGKTAIKHRLDPERKVTGAGYLNAYKLGQVAFRLRARCGKFDSEEKKKECARDLLKSEATYDFKGSIAKEASDKFYKAFPECSDAPVKNNPSSPTCEERKEALKEIRKASFLLPEDPSYWKNLACVSEKQGFLKNAEYYHRLAKGKRFTDHDRKKEKIASADVSEITSNRGHVLAAVKTNGSALAYVSNDLKKDREVVLAAVRNNGAALGYASEELQKDKEIVYAAVKNNGFGLAYVSDDLKKDSRIVLAAVRNNGLALGYASEALQNDKEIVLAAVRQKGDALQDASEALRNDKDVALAAIKSSKGNALQYVSEALKNDKDVLLAAVAHKGEALQAASETLKSDKDVVLAAVKSSKGEALQYASEEIKNDKQVVLAAVKSSKGWALQYASRTLKSDKSAVLAAVKISGFALQHASEPLRKDKDIVLSAVKNFGHALSYASEDLCGDKEIVFAAARNNGASLMYASEALKNDKEVVLAAVKSDGIALKHASEALKNDKEVVLAAIKHSGVLLKYASPELQKDPAIRKAAGLPE